jgi:hypothetical protein
MTTSEPACPDFGSATRRRSGRLTLVVPLEVQWQQARQGAVTEPARTRDMSPHGALLLKKNCPPLHASITLKNLLSGETAAGRVTHLRRSSDGKLIGAAVELLDPSDRFWGLTFQLQNTTAQLLAIENSFQAAQAGVDFRVLQGLREAVEDLHRVASAVQQWQELQVDGKDVYTVLELVTRARVDRAAYLLNELTADINCGAIICDSEEVGHLTRAVERFYERITQGPASLRHTNK